MIYLLLAWEFFKIGLFSMGGGLSSLPFLYELAERYEWLQAGEIPDIIAVAESTPGAIGVNAATYAGFTAAGIPGALVATLSYILPSLIIILLIAGVMSKYYEKPAVQKVFYGIRPAVTGLIAAAGLKVMLSALFGGAALTDLAALVAGFEWKAALLFAVLVFAVLKFKKHPIVYVAAAAAAGILLRL